jgi:hypothetical protein
VRPSWASYGERENMRPTRCGTRTAERLEPKRNRCQRRWVCEEDETLFYEQTSVGERSVPVFDRSEV